MKSYTVCIVLFYGFLTGCNLSIDYRDESIDSNIRSEIHAINNHVVEGMVEKNPYKIMELFSDILNEKVNVNPDAFINAVKEADDIKKGNFVILNEFYKKGLFASNYNTNIKGKTISGNKFTIPFRAVNKETYALISYIDKGEKQFFVITIYGKYEKDWKLNFFEVGLLSINRKDAVDWFNASKAFFESGQLGDAIANYYFADILLNASERIWQYEKKNDIEEYGERLLSLTK